MMSRKQMIGAAALIVLCSSFRVYGYWVDKAEAKCKISFAVPVQIQYRANEESQDMKEEIIEAGGD